MDPDPDSMGSLDPDPGGQKLPTEIEKVKKVLSLKCSLLRAEEFSCSLDDLYGSLGISKLQLLIKKRYKKNFNLFFFNFWLSKHWIRIGSGSISGSGVT